MNSSSSSPPVPPLIALAGGILAVSTASLFIRFAQEDAPSIVIAAWRLGIAALVLAPLALVRHRSEISNLNGRQKVLLIFSGLLLALHFATWITSLEFTSVASSVVLVTTTPLWVGLLSPLVLRERLSPYVQVGLLVALLGGVVVGMSEACQLTGSQLMCDSFGTVIQGRALTGNALALIGALCAAGYLLVGRSLRTSLSLVAYIFLVYGTAAVALLAAVLISGSPLAGYPSQVYIWFLALALVPQLLGHSAFNWSLKYLPAAIVSVTLLAEPIGSVLLAFIFLAESPGRLELLGALLILAGIYISSKT